MEKTETRSLLVRLTEEERTQRARQLADVINDIKNQKEEIKETTSAMKSTLNDFEKEKNELADAVRTGLEYRKVECTLTPRGNVWEISRNDTGEVIDSRVMTESDRQGDIDFD